MATWNIVDERGGRLAQAAAGLAQMKVGLAVLTESKLVNNRYPKSASGYTIMCSKAVSGHLGGVTLLWRENDPKFEVESVLFNNGPNIVTFQLTTGDERFYVIGIYVPPDCNKGVDDLRGAWEACPQGCKQIILGDLNINFGYPRDEREEIIVDLLDEINLIDSSRSFRLRTPRQASTRARWTWSQKRRGTRHYTQPDYIMARARDMSQLKGVGFRSPRFLYSDHRAVVANIREGRKGRLKNYRRMRQKFPLSLPLGPMDADTTTFDALAAECVNPKPKRAPGKDWISEGTWKLITKHASLLRSGKIRQTAARRMKREVNAALKADKSRLTAQVEEDIMSELGKGNVQEAFRHLKCWYRTASEAQAKPCHQTMERQTDERVELYAERDAYGEEFPANGTPFEIDDNPPSEGELRIAVSQLSHGRCGGASGIRAEHIKAWLRGAKREEDPKTAAAHIGAGKSWREFVGLCTSVWATGTIPQQLSWVVTVLIPKGGGEYRGIGLLEPIWKVMERVMDTRLETINLHDSLHGCLAGRGTGMGIIEGKLAQQLAHLEQRPFFGVFLDLKKAFDAMDRDRCLAILALHGVGPQLIRLIRSFWESATNVCQAKGNYGRPFKAGRGVTQGGPLSAKLFNILVDGVVREWMRLMRESLDDSDGQLATRMEELFAIFYVDDGYIASSDANFLQEALTLLVATFKRTGLATNTKKTQAMVCTPGRIRLQLLTDLYTHLREGVAAGEETTRAVVCHVCNKTLQARSLRPHLENAHEIYQQVVVPNDLLQERAGIRYKAERVGRKMPVKCPFPRCPGKLSSAYMLCRHFRDLHPMDSVEIWWEGHYPHCKRCAMQCNPKYPRHIHSQVCQMGVERRTQRETAITAALALQQLFYVEGEVLEKVDSFRYLGRILTQDNEDV